MTVFTTRKIERLEGMLRGVEPRPATSGPVVP